MTTTTVEQIKTQRRFSRTRLPLASGSGTMGWIQHINRLPFSEPFGEDRNEHRVPIYITASNKTGRDVEPGIMRSCRKNSDEWTRADYPWEVTDDSTFKVRGVAGNEFVQEGDMVWAPRRGLVTIDRVVYQGDVIYTVFARGSGEPITTWFRDAAFRIEAEGDPSTPVGSLPVQVGDVIVVEKAEGTDAHDGRVVTISEIDASTALPTFQLAWERVIVTEWILVRKAGSDFPETGTLVRPREFLPGATYEYRTIASDRVAVAIEQAHGYGPVWLSVMFPEAILGMGPGHRTPVHQWSIVGHQNSKHQHLIEGWKTKPVEVEKPASGERVNGHTAQEWSDKWDALWQALGHEANRREWCSEYDEFAEANGGPERTCNYRIVVHLEQTIGASVLDEALRVHLSSDNSDCDVQDDVTITNRISFTVEATAQQVEDDISAVADRWLQNSAYSYDSFEVVDYCED